MRILTLWIGLGLWLVACGHSGTAGAPSAQSPASAEAAPAAGSLGAKQPRDLVQHMRVSFWAAVDARDAIIDGDLTVAHERANYLAHEHFEALPERWQPWIHEMQKHAAELAMAPDVEEAAQWTASLALACGNCHWYLGKGPGYDTDEVASLASQPEDLRTRMLRHSLAADDLWMGLVRPSQGAWTRGARLLNEAPPERPTEPGGGEVDAAFAAQLNAIKALGLRAITAKTPHQRASVYGEFLARCAACHTLVAR